MKVKEYLDKKGFEYQEVIRKGGLNYLMICPFCNGGNHKENSFAIHSKTGYWNCLRKNNCGLTGTFFQFQEKLGDIPKHLDKNFINKNIKKEYNIPKIIKIELSEKCLDYIIYKRKLTKETIKYFNIFGTPKNEISFPYYKTGKLVNVIYRTIDKKFRQEKNCESILFNRDNVNIEEDFLIITEGEFDCMAFYQYGLINVVSMHGGASNLTWIENEWEFLENFKNIYLSMDMDIAGKNALKNLLNRLGTWRCKALELPFKDANECLIKEVSKKDILQCFKNAKEFPPIELVSAGIFKEKVRDIIRNPEKYYGIDTGLPELTKMLRGFRKGETTLWSGQNNSGKSTLLNQICLFLASKKIRICIASLELKPERYLNWAVCQLLGESNPCDEDIDIAFQWMDEWFYIINIDDNVAPEKIFELFEYAARRYDVEHFVVDSLMRIKLDNFDENKSQAEFTSNYVGFGKKFDVHCHLVAHPRKQENDNSKPGKTDVKGSGNITDLVDNVIIIWRKMIHSNDSDEDYYNNEISTALLFLRKNREFGDVGQIKLFFDKESRTYRCNGQKKIFY